MKIKIGKCYIHEKSGEFWRYDALIKNFMGSGKDQASLTIINNKKRIAEYVNFFTVTDESCDLIARDGAFTELLEWPYPAL